MVLYFKFSRHSKHKLLRLKNSVATHINTEQYTKPLFMQQFFACYETLYIQIAKKTLYVGSLHLHQVIILSYKCIYIEALLSFFSIVH